MIRSGLPRPAKHHRYPFQWLERPDQHGMRDIWGIRHDIEQMMDPIYEVYIGPPPGSVHHFRPGSPAAGPGMTGAVCHTVIGLRLHDPARSQLSVQLRHQYLAQQIPGDRHYARTVVERIIQFFNGWHRNNILSLKGVTRAGG